MFNLNEDNPNDNADKLLKEIGKINLEKKEKVNSYKILVKYEKEENMGSWSKKIKDTIQKMANIGYFLKNTEDTSNAGEDDFFFLLTFEEEQEV